MSCTALDQQRCATGSTTWAQLEPVSPAQRPCGTAREAPVLAPELCRTRRAVLASAALVGAAHPEGHTGQVLGRAQRAAGAASRQTGHMGQHYPGEGTAFCAGTTRSGAPAATARSRASGTASITSLTTCSMMPRTSLGSGDAGEASVRPGPASTSQWEARGRPGARCMAPTLAASGAGRPASARSRSRPRTRPPR